ncbi:MAG TPA: response regulator [Crinalium sp.]|jgi:DNA-binding response OmpR family regulator
MRILVVEDDENVAKTLKLLLSSYSYAVDIATYGEEGLQMADAFEYDLLLLDMVLPDSDGIKLCQQLRTQGHQMPILLLTGQGEGHQKTAALNTGADDYMVKPFNSEELIARIQALLRRGTLINQPVMTWGSLQLSPSSHHVTYNTRLLALTPKEYAILELLLRNSQRILSSRAILEHVWTAEDNPGEETVRVHIKGLRQKLRAAGAPATLIETVYGVGYRLNPLETNSDLVSKTPAQSAPSNFCADMARWNALQPNVMAISQNMPLLASLKAFLEPKSLQIMPLTDPGLFWETLDACSPDLLMLDFELSGVSSLELCQRMHRDPRWNKLPIIFLLPHTETALINQVFAAGANDFVSQPIVGPELIARVTSHLERCKLLHLHHLQVQ